MHSKTCLTCKEDRLLTDFYINNRTRDGLYSQCKSCWKAKASRYKKTKKGAEAVARGRKKSRTVGYDTCGGGALNRLRKASVKRGHSFSLTSGELGRWWATAEDRCHYCHTTLAHYRVLRDFVVGYSGDNPEVTKFQRCFKNSKHQKIEKMTIDRLDNSIGYTPDNMVKACWFCNYLKGDFFTSPQWQLVAPGMLADLNSQRA